MKERKKHRIPDYEMPSGDDIRTIPDFYDNLYPAPENPMNGIIIPLGSRKKKREISKNNEK